MASGRPDLPACCSSMAVASHAASMRSFSIPGVGERLAERLVHQILGAVVPALAELRASHPQDGHPITNSRCHVPFPPQERQGAAFQK